MNIKIGRSFHAASPLATAVFALSLAAAFLQGCSSELVASQEYKKTSKTKDILQCQANSQVNGADISEGLKVRQVGENEFEVIYQYLVDNKDQMTQGEQVISGKTMDYFEYVPTIQPGIVSIDLKNPTFKRKHGESSESKKLEAVRIHLVGKKLIIFTLKDRMIKKDTLIEMTNCESSVK